MDGRFTKTNLDPPGVPSSDGGINRAPGFPAIRTRKVEFTDTFKE